MDEKDKELQELRREIQELKEFQFWLKTEAFGPDQFRILMLAYEEDKNERLLS